MARFEQSRFRQPPNPEDIELVNNIQTYSVGYLFDQKMNAIEKRTVARDLYDITHLVKTQGDELSPEQIARVDNFSNDIDKLASLFADSFETGENLNKISTVEDTVLALREALEEIEYSLDNTPDLDIEDDDFDI